IAPEVLNAMTSARVCVLFAAFLLKTLPSTISMSAAVLVAGWLAFVASSLNLRAPQSRICLRASVAASNWPRPPVLVCWLPNVPLLGLAGVVADGGDAVADARVREGRLGVGVPDLVQVHQPEGDGVHADRVGRLLHGDLERERPVRVRHAPVGPRLEAVGEDI